MDVHRERIGKHKLDMVSSKFKVLPFRLSSPKNNLTVPPQKWWLRAGARWQIVHEKHTVRLIMQFFSTANEKTFRLSYKLQGSGSREADKFYVM